MMGRQAMANESGNQPPRPSNARSELMQAILAIALAIAAQSAVRDGFLWLGLAGFVIAALLFVTSVGAIFRASTAGETMPATRDTETAAAEAESELAVDGMSKLRYLRRHWRLVTIAEIFAGDIPPAPVDIPEASAPGDDLIVVGTAGAAAMTNTIDSQATAKTQETTATASPTPKAVKVTAGGNVLVLDTSRKQVQRFDEQGSLLATYSLPELAGIMVLDLDVSPDGKTLYVVDETSRLRVISLGEKGLTGGSEKE